MTADTSTCATHPVIPPLRTPEAELELFMNEMVTVIVADSTDENAVPFCEIGVNGRKVYIERGKPTQVKRMYVERLARAKKTSISQNLDPRLGEGVNQLHRKRALDYPFSTMDDTDKGREWLKRVLAEA